MTTPFDPTQGLIVVSAMVEGPAARVLAHLALDTGATDTAISAARLQAALDKSAEAAKSLASVIKEATQAGYVSFQFEARLALGGGAARLRGSGRVAGRATGLPWLAPNTQGGCPADHSE